MFFLCNTEPLWLTYFKAHFYEDTDFLLSQFNITAIALIHFFIMSFPKFRPLNIKKNKHILYIFKTDIIEQLLQMKLNIYLIFKTYTNIDIWDFESESEFHRADISEAAVFSAIWQTYSCGLPLNLSVATADTNEPGLNCATEIFLFWTIFVWHTALLYPSVCVPNQWLEKNKRPYRSLFISL